MERSCPVCHAEVGYVEVPGVTRHATVYTCLNCGVLQIMKKEEKEDGRDP